MANATETVNLRIQPAIRDLIDQAADAVGSNRTEFILAAAHREAESVLLDQRLFHVDGDRFEALKAALDQPTTDVGRLRRTLQTPAPWER